jgi:hypothetical protein
MMSLHGGGKSSTVNNSMRVKIIEGGQKWQILTMGII